MSLPLLLALLAFVIGTFPGVPKVNLVSAGLAFLTVWLAWPHFLVI